MLAQLSQLGFLIQFCFWVMSVITRYFMIVFRDLPGKQVPSYSHSLASTERYEKKNRCRKTIHQINEMEHFAHIGVESFPTSHLNHLHSYMIA